MVAIAIGVNIGSAVDKAATNSPGTDSAGMLGMSMVGTCVMAVAGAATLFIFAAKVRPKRRWRNPPGWPPAPTGWEPPAGWTPDPSWPRPPHDWEWWDDEV